MKQPTDNTLSRYQQIADDLRLQIIHSVIEPGQKLPTFDELVVSYGTSRSIVQMAIGQLRDLGFIRSDGRRGMFVEDYPPHLYRFGILFSGHPGDAYWSRFNTSLTNEAMRLQIQTPGYRFTCYYDLNKQNASEDFNQLIEDVQNKTLAGIIVVPFCDQVLKHLAFEHSKIPILNLFGPEDSERLPSITTDCRNYLIDQVMPQFKALGARRIAVVELVDHLHPQLVSDIQACGLESQRSWIQYVSRDYPQFVRRIIWLLFERPPEQRPDGLLIMDDNLIEHAMLGLNDCRIHPGQDVHVFAKNTWPSESPNMLPIHRFGVHTGQLLTTACRTFDQMRKGESVPAFQCMPLWFEDEIPASVTLDDSTWLTLESSVSA